MALIPEFFVSGAVGAAKIVPVLGLGAGLDLSVNPAAMQFLSLTNTGTEAVKVIIKGDQAPSDFVCPGTAKTMDLSGGYEVSLAAGEITLVCLRQIQKYLAGKVTVTANLGAEAVAAFVMQ